MSKEVKKFLVFVVVMGLAFVIIDYVGYRVLDGLFNNMKHGREYNTRMAVLEASPELLFLGASQCQGNYDVRIFEEQLGLDAFNAGMGAQHIDYQVLVGKKVIQREKPEVIVWDFDPKLFAGDNGVYLKTGLNPYYHDDAAIKKRLDESDIFMRVKHTVFSYRYNSLLMQILNANLGKVDQREGYTPYPCGRSLTMEVVDKSSYKPLDEDSERKIGLMRSTLAAWKSAGIKVYVIISPIYKRIEHPIEGIEMAKKICDETGVEFHDFSQLEGIFTNPAFFRDNIHLCKEGATVYSRHVVDALRGNQPSRPVVLNVSSE